MVVLKGPSFVVLSKLSLLGASVLGYSLGSLRHGVLGQFSGEEQMDSGLDLSGVFITVYLINHMHKIFVVYYIFAQKKNRS